METIKYNFIVGPCTNCESITIELNPIDIHNFDYSIMCVNPNCKHHKRIDYHDGDFPESVYGAGVTMDNYKPDLNDSLDTLKFDKSIASKFTVEDINYVRIQR